MNFRFRLVSSLGRLGLGRGLMFPLTAAMALYLGNKLRLESKCVASYAFGGHFDGSISYPKKSVIP
jgi:hypothetical protein